MMRHGIRFCAAGTILVGVVFLWLAWTSYGHQAHLQKVARQFLHAVVAQNLQPHEDAYLAPIRIRLGKIRLQGEERAYVPAVISLHDHKIQTEILLVTSGQNDWTVLGVTELSSELSPISADKPDSPALDQQLKTAFQHRPGVEIQRF